MSTAANINSTGLVEWLVWHTNELLSEFYIIYFYFLKSEMKRKMNEQKLLHAKNKNQNRTEKNRTEEMKRGQAYYRAF